MMGSRKRLFLAALLSTIMALCFAIGFDSSRTNRDHGVNAASGATSVAISADGVSAVGDSYSIPVGADQSFSALGQAADGGVELLPAGVVDWSLATDGEASLNVAEGDLVATVSALAPGTAGLYVTTADGLADLVNLDLYALTAEGKTLSSLAITSPVDGATIIVNQGDTGIPLGVTSALNDPTDTSGVEYTFDGNQTATATLPPYAISIPDVTALTAFTIQASATSYESYNEYTDSVTFSVDERVIVRGPTGFPNNPFSLFNFNNLPQLFLSSFTTPPFNFQSYLCPLPGILAKSIDIPVGGATASIVDPNDNSRIVTVIVPAGLVEAGEQAILFFAAADSPTELVGATEAGDVGTEPAGGLVPGARYAEVSILVSTDSGATFAEIDNARLLDNPITIVFSGVTIAPGDNARIFEHASSVIDTDAGAGVSLAIDVDAAGEWGATDLGSAVDAGQISAQLTSLSLLAPYLTPGNTQIVSVSDAFDFSIGGKSIEVTVTNATASDDFTVTIDGVEATITDATADGSNVVLTVTVPAAAALDAPADSADVDVKVVNATNTDFDALPNGFTYNGPDVTAITPTEGTEEGGTAVQIAATGVDSSLSSVSLGGAALTSLTQSAGNIYGTTTSASPGTVDVVVTLTNNYTGTLVNGYTYTAASPIVTSVFPNAVFNDGGYSVRVNGQFFLDTSAQAKAAGSNYVLFTNTPDVQSFGTDNSAAEVEFIDDTKLDALTPTVTTVGLYNVYVATSTYAKAGSVQLSNLVDFTFVDIANAQLEIYNIDPKNGPLEGGNRVNITGDGFPPSDIIGKMANGGIDALYGGGKGTATGNVLQVADTFAEAGTTGHNVRVSLFRDPVGGGSQAPASIDADITYDDTVLTAVAPGFQVTTNLLLWYGKTASTNITTSGTVGLVISGGTFEITTVDDQQGSSGASENPFNLGNLKFNVIGADGATSAIDIAGLSMATAAADPITNASGDGGVFTVGCPTSTVEELLASADTNSDGEVSFAEFQAFIPCAVQADYDALDINSDGTLNSDDIILTPPTCDEVVAGADADSDGNVTFAEYDAFFSQATQEQFDALDTNDDGVVNEDDCAQFGDPKVKVYFGVNEADVRAVVAAAKAYGNYTGSTIRATAPAGEAPGAVDVRVELVADPSIFAISRVYSIYAQPADKIARPGDGGYTYDDFGINTVSPDTTWLFGGESVVIEGAGFDPATVVVTIGDQVAELDSSALQTATQLTVVVPGLVGVPNGAPATETVDVTVTNQSNSKTDTLVDGFTYVRYSTDSVSEGASTGVVYTTAFSFESTQGSGDAEVVLNNTGSLAATLNIPAFTSATVKGAVKTGNVRVFGLARATKTPELVATQSLVGDPIVNIWNFDLHLYDGAAPHDEIQIAFSTKDVPIKLSYPVDDVVPALTTTTVGGGLVATWSNPTDFAVEYSNRATGFSGTPVEGDFQSQLLPEEFTVNGSDLVTIHNSRLYSLGTSYALRLNAGPDEVDAEFGDDQDTVVEPGDTIVCQGRGLGYADIEILDGSDAKASVDVTNILTQDEFGVSFELPAGLAKGDITVRLTVPTRDGDEEIELRGLRIADRGFGGILLGLLAALLGILAGGDGGGGGGTCFIATAAYGTPVAGEIDTLRAVRDEFMLNNAFGNAFVDAYYSVSPAIADVVAKSPVLAASVRLLLMPIIFAGKMLLAMPQVSLLLSFGAMALLSYRFNARRKAAKKS